MTGKTLAKNQLNYIAIDFETANTCMNSACSVGLVRFTDGKEDGSAHSLIHPAKMYFIQEWTDTIHHISYNDVRDKPYFPEVWQAVIQPFLAETPDYPLVAHNGNRFDMKVIQKCCDYFGFEEYPDFEYFDSLQIAKKTWPKLECHQLTFLGKTFGIEYKAHDALDDSRTCGKIVALAAKEHGVQSVNELMGKCGLEMKRL